jgi:predicted nucleotidyltransferase
MATIPLPPDFKEFLKLLNSHNVKYLLIGGYAVNYYGYARATADMDIWVGISPENADGTSAAVREFGFMQATVHLFLEPGNVIRMGLPPFRIEVLTSVSGVEFSDCFRKRNVVDIGGLQVSLIAIDDLRANKRASGRTKDLADLEQLD